MKYVAESVLGMILLLFTGCQTGSTHPSGIQVFPLKDRFPQNDPYHEFRFHAPGRIVAIGDLHGDFAATEGALRVAGAIDASNHWIGGNLVVVQTGDQIDRWDNDREILDFLSNLQTEAEAAGGRVILVNGNHELWNVFQHFNYVTPRSFKEFLDFPVLQTSLPANLSLSRGDRFGVAKKVTRTSPGVLQRVNAFLPGASYAKLLAKRPFFSIVNDTVFVHGGLTLEDFAYGLPKLNEEIRQWLLGNTKFVDLPERASNTIAGRGGDNSVWNRKYSMGNPSAAHCELLKPIFAALGVKRMVVGHTIQDQGINEACEGKVWRIDIALSRGYSYVNPQVLAIDDNQIKILAPKSIDLRDEDSMAPLHIAAQNGHTVKVKELLLAGADKNMPTYQGVTPILFAASNDQLKVVHTLTEAKVDCDKSDIFGWTPLIAAVVNQNVLIVDALLRAGANKDKANQDGWTPIAIAADKGNLEVTRRLIREKVDLEKASREGFTPLAQAVARGRESIVTLLLKEGANPLRVGKNNISILDLAERGPNRKIEKLIRNAIK